MSEEQNCKELVSGEKNKIVIAVHGVGDQIAYETIQSVIRQFCHFFDVPFSVPLGAIHSAVNESSNSNDRIYRPSHLYPHNFPNTLGFGEVYWADIARDLVEKGYILEDTEKWSKTIVNRMRLNKESEKVDFKEKDYSTLKKVLAEMIETVNVLEWISFLADKAGIFKFRLKKLLRDYVDDVQTVTEYREFREEILERFNTVMRKASSDKNAEIYIVAHSEGSVVALLGLLQALKEGGQGDYAWINQVRGLMTIGSPIDKHLILWPELFELNIEDADKDINVCQSAIKWRNYYDYGDPIGSKLEIARSKFCQSGSKWFDFGEVDDCGFSRYHFPGKAHTDYWDDDQVFGHFIKTVMHLLPRGNNAQEKGKQLSTKPKSKPSAVLSTATLPYLFLFALMSASTYFLYHAITNLLDWYETSFEQLRNTLAVAFLLSGITVLARIPRLTKSIDLKLAGIGMFIVSCYLFFLISTEAAINNLEGFTNSLLPVFRLNPASLYAGFYGSTIGMVVFAASTAIIIFSVNKRYPQLGLKPLLLIGGLATIAVEANIIMNDNIDNFDSLWQVVLATVLFLCFWWLAALTFDLVFVWRGYIRAERAILPKKKTTTKEAATPAVSLH